MFEKEAEEYASQGGLSKEKHFFGVKAIAFKDGAEYGYNKAEKELTKAKKIVGNLYAICKDNHYPNISILMEQAEQFLKED